MDGHLNPASRTFTATEFKAKCLDILDRVSAGEWTEVQITKRGRVVGVLKAPRARGTVVLQEWSASMAGSVLIPEGLDLTAPVLDEASDAEAGILHR